MIKTKNNSNQKTQQTTLTEEIVQEYTYYLLGFIPTNVIRQKSDKWCIELDYEQIKSIEQFLYFQKKVYS